MKKTLIALFALGCMAAYGDTAFTIDSKLITSAGTASSAYDAIVGYSKTDAQTNTGLTIDRLGYTNCTADLYLEQMYHSVMLTGDQKYTVTAVTMGFRYDQQSSYQPTGTYLTTTVNNVEYRTGEVVLVGTNGSTGTMTWTFDTPFEISGTEAITLSIHADDGTKYGFTVGKNKDSNQLVGVNDFSDGWKPIVRVSGVIKGGGNVPEPATGSLSLLALAGLCARRRRK